MEKCLYLDTDVIVLTDLRELFAYDLGGYIAASSTGGPDSHGYKALVRRKKRGGGDEVLAFETDFYFCSGLMLINVDEWIKNDIESRAILFLSNYETEFADQDSLNFAMKNRVFCLSGEWGILAFQYIGAKYGLNANRKYVNKYENTVQNAKILHCNGPAKAWFGKYDKLTEDFLPNHYPHKHVWCEMAKLCNGFEDDLRPIINHLENEGLHEYSIALSMRIREELDKYNLPAIQRRVERISKPHKAFLGFLKRLFGFKK